MYTVKVVHRFVDTTCNPVKMREIGDVYDIPNIERLIELLGENRNKTKYVEFVSSKKPSQYKRTGKKVVFYENDVCDKEALRNIFKETCIIL